MIMLGWCGTAALGAEELPRASVGSMLPGEKGSLYSGQLALGFKTGSILGGNGYQLGVQGGWFVTDRLTLGGTLYTLISERYPHNVPGAERVQYTTLGVLSDLMLYHQGLYVVSTSLAWGAGFTGYRLEGRYKDVKNNFVEPALNLALHVGERWDVGFAISYKGVFGNDIAGINRSDLGSWFFTFLLNNWIKRD
jgi:hypothetical protein